MKRIYTTLVAGVFMLSFLVIVIFGAQTYQRIAASQKANNDHRAINTYLTTITRSMDAAGSLGTYESEYGTVLSIGDDAYRIRIYRRDGMLVEDFGPAEGGLNPDAAQILGPCEVFTVETVDEHTLKVTTDAGESLLHQRSTGGVS